MKEKNIDFGVFEKVVKENSNDSDLGGAIRLLYWDFIGKNNEVEKNRNL